MEATTTTLGAIAKGHWKWIRQATSTDEVKHEALYGDDWDEGECIVFHAAEWDVSEAHKQLIADAGNTAQKTGKLPSQLLQERDELVKELENILEWHRIETTPLRERELKSIADLIYRVTNPKP